MKSINYPIGDFFIRLKNSLQAGVYELEVPKTKLIKKVASLLEKKGFLSYLEERKETLFLHIKVVKKTPVIVDVELVSKPSLRVYWKVEDLKKGLKKGPGIYILSTPKGVLSSDEALKKNVGGEVIAKII